MNTNAQTVMLNLDYDSYGLSSFDKEVVKDMILELLPASFNDEIEKVIYATANRNLITFSMIDSLSIH